MKTNSKLCNKCPIAGTEACANHKDEQDCISLINESRLDEVMSFYEQALTGTMRQLVAHKLMPLIPALDKLKGEAYYQAEDAICDFIKSNQWEIARNADKLYMAEDLCTAFFHLCEITPSAKTLNALVGFYDDALADDDVINDARGDIERSIVKDYLTNNINCNSNCIGGELK